MLGQSVEGTQWHLFGSVNRNEPDAEDIDLMILCETNEQADTLRQSIDPDSFELPLHLALLTFDEAVEVDAIRVQRSCMIFP
jgi:predicted nucleotidyltransferase